MHRRAPKTPKSSRLHLGNENFDGSSALALPALPQAPPAPATLLLRSSEIGTPQDATPNCHRHCPCLICLADAAWTLPASPTNTIMLQALASPSLALPARQQQRLGGSSRAGLVRAPLPSRRRVAAKALGEPHSWLGGRPTIIDGWG